MSTWQTTVKRVAPATIGAIFGAVTAVGFGIRNAPDGLEFIALGFGVVLLTVGVVALVPRLNTTRRRVVLSVAPPAVHTGLVLVSGLGVVTALVSLWGVLFWLPLVVGFEYGATVSNENIYSYASVGKPLTAIVSVGSVLLAVGYVSVAWAPYPPIARGILNRVLFLSFVALVLLLPVLEKFGACNSTA